MTERCIENTTRLDTGDIGSRTAGSPHRVLSLEAFSEYIRDVWVGDLVEGCIEGSPGRLRRWAFLCILRMCAVTFVFATPWALAKGAESSFAWGGTTAVLALASAYLSHRTWQLRSWGLVGNVVYLSVACPLVSDFHGPAASYWIPLTGLISIAAIGSGIFGSRAQLDRLDSGHAAR